MSRSAYCYSTAAEGAEGSTAEGANTEAPPVEGHSNPVADAAKGKEAQAGPSEHEQLLIKKDKEVAELKVCRYQYSLLLFMLIARACIERSIDDNGRL